MYAWVHDGFVFPGNRLDYHAMNPGWGRVVDSIGRVASEAQRASGALRQLIDANALAGR
jgi:hypothetical protein